VKVCGITSPEDASAAVEAGADAVGVVLAESPRRVDLARAREVFAAVPPLVSRVGVFVDADPGEVEEAVDRLALDLVQFHGTETPEACAESPAPAVKAFRVAGTLDPGELEAYRGTVAAILLDTLVAGVAGGTGTSFDWAGVGALPEWAPVFVAGGLDAGNVGDAIATLGPFAVDVSSGVESAPGVKDPGLVTAFIRAVRAADEGRA
jgi:phosphoribosylanthranilate isomerase